MEKLVIIRGPSGSGKSSVAKELFRQCSRPTLLVSEDQIRQMFNDWKQPNHTTSKNLAMAAVIEGLQSGYDVIYEGISNIKTYKIYFQKIFAVHPTENYLFYLNVSFDETVRRHNMRPQKTEFSIETMKTWWDYASPTGYSSETIIPEDSSLAETVKSIDQIVQLKLQ